jgi:serine/threonine protein kinase/Flp pilus assembly protein TadD
MTPGLWQKPGLWERLKPLFHEVMEKPEDERDRYIDEICHDNHELREALHRLVKARGDSTSPADGPMFDLHQLFPEHQNAFAGGELVLERFRIVRLIGSGGMGEVYEGLDLDLGQRIALKTIRAEISGNPKILAHFKNEVKLAKKISGLHVCRIHELYPQAERPDGRRPAFLTMEFLEGATLADRIREQGPLPWKEIKAIALEICEGLRAMHEAGIIHRDLKCRNVMLADRNGIVRAVIMDFGLAREMETATSETVSEMSQEHGVAGTVEYMAPEQFEGQRLTPAADIFALGVVMYEMATAKRPFPSHEILQAAVQRGRKPSVPSSIQRKLPRRCDEIVGRCLEFDPKKRYGSAKIVAEEIKDSWKVKLRRTWLRASAAVLAVIALASGLMLVPTIRERVEGIMWAWTSGAITSRLMPSEQRVGVLEFENVGGDPANQAFCDGLMETLSSQLTELEQFHGSLSVVPASDIRKQKVTSAREAQRDFNVTLVITGSVQRSPTGVRLTINVVDARQLKQLRSHTMFIPETDAVSMQERVIGQVTELLDIQMRPDAQHRLAVGRTSVSGAYAYYLQGYGYLLQGNGAADQAITEFQQALRLDPDYALAHAGLGRAYWSKYLATKDRSWIDQAWQECSRAIELGPQLSDPHVTLALLSSGTGKYEEAIREAKQAIQIDPNNDRGYSELARALDATGQTDAAEVTLKKAISIRPDYWYNYARLGFFYGQHTRYKEAETQFQRVIELVPDNPAGYTNLAAIYHLEGRESDAEKMLKKSIQLEPTNIAYSNLATVYFFEGRYADAVPIMEKLASDTKGVCGNTQEYVQCGNLGDDYRWTHGNAKKAALAYQKAVELAQDAVNVNPRDATALSGIALYRAKLGQSNEAQQTIEKALALAPDDETVLFDAAVVYELAGARARALKFLQGAVIGGYSSNEIAAEPELRKLREDPRYQAAVTRNH